MRIAIIGLGLIGGSLARAFSYYTDHTVLGMDKDNETLISALNEGVISEACEELPMADLYFLAMSPTVTIDFFKANASKMQKNAIVTDVCGVKDVVTSACEEVALKNNLRFVGGHPMAGREVSGFENSVVDLFKDRCYILTTTDNTDPAALEIIKNLVLTIGINKVTVTTPLNHDRLIAFTSQLPHILAGAYMKSPSSKEHSGYSAGSYHDVSRVSSVDENLWSELFLANRDYLAVELKCLIGSLCQYLNAVERSDKDELHRLIKESRLLKEKDLKINGNEKPHKFG